MCLCYVLCVLLFAVRYYVLSNVVCCGLLCVVASGVRCVACCLWLSAVGSALVGAGVCCLI